jgi:hypothetical protein
MGVNGQIHPPSALPLDSNLLYSLNMKLSGLQSRTGHCGEDIMRTLRRQSNRDSSGALFGLCASIMSAVYHPKIPSCIDHLDCLPKGL